MDLKIIVGSHTEVRVTDSACGCRYLPVSVQEGIERAAIAPAGREVDTANARVAFGSLLSP